MSYRIRISARPTIAIAVRDTRSETARVIGLADARVIAERKADAEAMVPTVGQHVARIAAGKPPAGPWFGTLPHRKQKEGVSLSVDVACEAI